MTNSCAGPVGSLVGQIAKAMVRSDNLKLFTRRLHLSIKVLPLLYQKLPRLFTTSYPILRFVRLSRLSRKIDTGLLFPASIANMQENIDYCKI